MCSFTSCWRAPVLGKPGIGAYAINLFSYAINVFPHQLLEAPVLGKPGIGAYAINLFSYAINVFLHQLLEGTSARQARNRGVRYKSVLLRYKCVPSPAAGGHQC